MLVRVEVPQDRAAISAVVEAAFGRPDEARLVEALRTSSAWLTGLSLVATDPGRPRGPVVGHVLCTRGFVGDTPALGLAPLAVVPRRQRSGVGAALIHAVLGAADALGEPLVALLGDRGYYARFGFVRSGELGIDPPDPRWAAHFQVRPLSAYGLHGGALCGTFRYAPAFDAVG